MSIRPVKRVVAATPGTKTEIDLQHYSQKEAVCFKKNNAVFIADEKVKKAGGEVFEMTFK